MKKLDSDFTESDVTVDAILAKAAEKAASKKAEVDAAVENQSKAQALSRDMAEFVAELVNPKDPSKIEKMKMSDGRIILRNKDNPTEAVIVFPSKNGGKTGNIHYTKDFGKSSTGRYRYNTLISYESGMVKYNTDTGKKGYEFTYTRTTQANEPYFQLQNQLYKYLND